MVVRRWGEGRPIVYLHGLGEAGACFAGLIAEPALAGFTHVVPDLPGYGRSPWPAQPASLDQLADQLVAWLARFPAPPIVVGHSMGGVLALLIAERAPARIAAVVDLDGNVSLGDCTFSAKAAVRSLDELIAGEFDRLRDEVFAGAATDRALRGYHAALRFADPATYHRHSRDLVELSTAETMAARRAALSVPLTFVAGVPDGVCARTLELLASAGVRWIGVEPAGHWVFVDQPATCAAIIARA